MKIIMGYLQRSNVPEKKFVIFFSTLFLLFCLSILSMRVVMADTLTLPPGVPAPSFVNDMIVVDDINNGNDSTGYGNVPYEYRVSQTQITVGDWVAFLNAVDPSDNLNLKSSYTHKNPGWGSWIPYQHNGSSWSVKSPYNNGVIELSSSDAAQLPVDGISLNQVARYMNWLATGNINQGAFTFSNNSNGNSNITGFDATYPGPRLPLENELYKAMYWHNGSNAYRLYPNGSNSAPSAANVDTLTGDYTTSSSTALYGAWDFVTGPSSNSAWAKVGQETSGNAWGFHDMSGNRHETTLELNQTMAQLLAGATGTPTGNAILRGASGFDTPIAASRSDWRNPAGGNNGGGAYTLSSQEPSIGFRVWMGVPVPSGRISITKQVTGGTDPQTFTLNLDCPGTNHDVSNISLTAGQTYTTPNTIPAGTQCTVTETTPTAPSGYSYGTPVISPSPVTVGDGTTVQVTVTNPLQQSSGDLQISKTVIGAPSGFTSPNFSATVDCNDGTAHDETFNLQDGDTHSITGIPAGTVCTVTEGAQPSPPAGYLYGSATYSPAGANTSGVTIVSGTTVSVGITNPLAQGCDINPPTITPSCDDNGTPTNPNDDTFTFTINASGVAVGATYSVSAPASAGLSPNPVTGLSYNGATAALSGPFDIADGAFNITLTDVDDNSCTTTATVTPPATCSNLQVGSLQISKDVTGEPGGFTSPDYSIEVACSDNSFDQTITLQDGQSQTISNIPEGTTCTITEPSQPAAPAGYSYGSPTVAPSSVTIQGNQTATVLVTNPLNGDCVMNQPTVTPQCYDNGTPDESDDTFAFLINTSGDFTAATYDIQGAIDVFDVPYGVDSGAYGNFLITGGDVTLNLVDGDDNACQQNNVTVSAPQPCSTTPSCEMVTNTASVTAMNESDEDTTNDADGVTVRADCTTTPQIDLVLAKTASQTQLASGDTFTYTLTLTNQGPDMATEVEVEDQLPTGVTYVSNTPSQGTYDATTGVWRVGDVANQGQATLTITVTVD